MIRQWLLLTTLTPCLAVAQADIKYKPRGDRWEGTRSEPVSGFEVELLSATIDYVEPKQLIGDTFRVRFYLEKDHNAAYVLVRELDNRYYYWLDKVQPGSPWQAGKTNEYFWSTAAVIKPLGDLTLQQLGVVVRLEKPDPSPKEIVAPAVLYQSSATTKSVAGYRFAFKLRRGGKDLKGQTFADGDLTRSLWSSELGRKSAGDLVAAMWPVDASTSRGWYRFVLEGVSLGTGMRVSQVVRFYHEPSLQ